MTDKRPRCGELGPGHGDVCVMRPGHAGDHLFQPRGQKKSAARTWPQKLPTLAKGVKTPLPAKDYRTTRRDDADPGLSERDE